ncbi:MAG: type II secretion system F family protein, partial [Candidatus Omnitrophica bacterium]|nr:type II secretion system F family protein [Candidatus Omnitrophota bacterium]
MPNFKYIAKNKDGSTLSGIIESRDRASAIDLLRKKDLIIVSVVEEAPKIKVPLPFLGGRKKKIKLDDLVMFARQLATMVDAGITLVAALDILGEQMDNKTFGAIVLNVRNDVETGSSLSAALGKHKNVFSPLFVNMVRAGESSGMLDEILDRLSEYLEKSSSLQKKVKSAMVYPAIVSGMALGITALLLLKVVPIFKVIFEGFGAKLPAPTMFLINLSDFMQKYFLLIVLVIGGIIYALIRYIRTDKGRLKFDGFLLKLPVFGILLKKVAISKFTRTLSTLIKAGVPILSALEIVGKTSGNKVVEMAIENTRTNVREGESIAEPLAKSKIFPPMVTRMISVGEQAGELEKMLSKIADFYDEQVDASVGALTSMIEPFIIAFLGIVIGSIVICMFLPIFKLT